MPSITRKIIGTILGVGAAGLLGYGVSNLIISAVKKRGAKTPKEIKPILQLENKSKILENIKCSKCGETLKSYEFFCRKCGTPMEEINKI